MTLGNLPPGSLLLLSPFSRAFRHTCFHSDFNPGLFCRCHHFSLYGVLQFLSAAVGSSFKQKLLLKINIIAYIHNVEMVNFS